VQVATFEVSVGVVGTVLRVDGTGVDGTVTVDGGVGVVATVHSCVVSQLIVFFRVFT